MSLTDSDKSNIQRKAPDINSPDKVGFRMAHNTNQTTYRESGGAVTARMQFVQAGIMWIDSDNKVNQVDMYIPELSSTPVLIIAEPGQDVFVDVLNGTVDRPRV